MTYQLHKNGDETVLVNPNGDEVRTIQHPLDVPGDIIEAILDDMGVGNPQKEALKVLLERDWEVVESD